jgi:Raf kinase inhibitor-like YbhB/YbcL family protein
VVRRSAGIIWAPGIVLTILLSGLAGCAWTSQPTPPPVPSQASQGGVKMKITSLAFADGEMIPKKYTCDSDNVSPALAWSDAPAGVKSFALIMDDPDAPAGTWVHWVLFNLPAALGSLPEAVSPQRTLPAGGVQGTSSFRRVGYGGPCPPSGTHRYFFKLYALDGPLSLTSAASANDVQAAMKSHILAEAQLMGRYKR